MSKPAQPTGYVVWYCEHLRDGQEEGAKCFKTKDEALKFINDDMSRFFARDNYSVQLFEMGKEIPLVQRTVKEHEKVVVKERRVYDAG